MLHRILLIFIFSFTINILFAQRAHNIHFEFLGAGLVYSINYDTRFKTSENGLGIRTGIGYIKVEDSNLGIPVQLNYLLGNNNHKFEIGAGISMLFQNDRGNDNENYFFPSGALMYRFQSTEKRIIFRAGLSPIFAPEEDGAIINTKLFWFWPGIGLGYRF